MEYDESPIVEYHPQTVQAEPYVSTIDITIRHFKRYVYRPIVGHDILVDQIPGQVYPYIGHTTERFEDASEEELVPLIDYELHDYDGKNWKPFAIKAAAFVRNEGLQGQHFSLQAEEGNGTLYAMDESLGWWPAWMYNADCQPQRTSDPCSLCMENLTDNAPVLLGMKCGHVFHHDCLTDWIWNNSSCPNCRARFPIS